MRSQLDTALEQKIANPGMDLYSAHDPDHPPTSQLIQAIIDLITSEDYERQVCIYGSETFYKNDIYAHGLFLRDKR